VVVVVVVVVVDRLKLEGKSVTRRSCSRQANYDAPSDFVCCSCHSPRQTRECVNCEVYNASGLLHSVTATATAA